jgi:hypothetical protein
MGPVDLEDYTQVSKQELGSVKAGGREKMESQVRDK